MRMAAAMTTLGRTAKSLTDFTWHKRDDEKRPTKPRCKTITNVFEYNSVKARKHKARGIATLCQTAKAYICTRDALSVPAKDRMHYQG